MIYNLLKMYGIDTIIAQVRGEWVGWFMTPGESITEINDDSNEDDWMDE